MDSSNCPLNQEEQHLKTLAVLARYAAMRADQTEDKSQAGIEAPERHPRNENSEGRYH